MSLSSRRAWIEISKLKQARKQTGCRSPHGERGLKFTEAYRANYDNSRSPHGERGLKLCCQESL